MPHNQAAWIETLKAKPLVVKDAPYTPAGPNEIVIKNAVLALNPADAYVQVGGMIPMDYPNILGNDVAGIVEEVGQNVTNFQKGDRVIAAAPQLLTGKPQNGGFQLYTVVTSNLACKIPSSMPFEQGVVLPLAIITASHGLFDADKLNLAIPSAGAIPRNEVVIVWGGASSVGGSAIQLLKAAGYELIATASAKNHDHVRSLGASTVIDYNSSNVVQEIVEAVKASGKNLVGVFDSISKDGPGGTIEKDIEIVKSVPNAHKHVASVFPHLNGERDGVQLSGMFASKNFENENARKAWEFMPEALEKGLIKPLPKPEIVGKGLESIQQGLDLQLAGVSAKKLIITL